MDFVLSAPLQRCLLCSCILDINIRTNVVDLVYSYTCLSILIEVVLMAVARPLLEILAYVPWQLCTCHNNVIRKKTKLLHRNIKDIVWCFVTHKLFRFIVL